MRKSITYLSFTSLLLIFGLAMAGCSRGSAKTAGRDPVAGMDSLPEEVRDVIRAVINNDSVAFSGLVSYPLSRPYPLHDIMDSVQMCMYYPVMVDDSLRKVIAESAPEDWGEDGWRGWTVGNGNYLWIDGALYEVGYISDEERTRRNDLITREIRSLSPELRGGWIPEWCMSDPVDGTIYRIDADSLMTVSGEVTPGLYRLAIYMKGADLRGKPMRVIKGHKDIEGTAGAVLYYFGESGASSGKISDIDAYPSEYVIEAFSADTGKPRLHRQGKDGRAAADRDLQRVYWLEILK